MQKDVEYKILTPTSLLSWFAQLNEENNHGLFNDIPNVRGSVLVNFVMQSALQECELNYKPVR